MSRTRLALVTVAIVCGWLALENPPVFAHEVQLTRE